MIDESALTTRPDFARFPSAQAQNRAPVERSAQDRPGKRRRALSFLLRSLLVVLVLVACVGGALFYALTQGGVSNDQIRAQLENRLTAALGPSLQARLGDAQVSVGRGGLLTFGALDARIIDDDARTLTAASRIDAQLDFWAILQGRVQARSVSIAGGALDISAFVQNAEVVNDGRLPKAAVDFERGLKQLATVLDNMIKSIDRAGLKRFDADGVKLLGLEAFPVDARSVSLEQLRIVRAAGAELSGVLAINDRSVPFEALWQPQEDGGKRLTLDVDRLTVADLFFDSEIVAGLKIAIDAPFDVEGNPREATAKLNLDGLIVPYVKGRSLMRDGRGILNLRLLPDRNQIELDPSRMTFASSEAELVGGLQLPRSKDDPSPPRFEIIANDVLAYGVVNGDKRHRAAMQFTGHWAAKNNAIVADTIAIKTPGGLMKGDGRLTFSESGAAAKADLKIGAMPVEQLKQFWPDFLAPKVREWIADGVTGGDISDAVVAIDFPSGLLGRDDLYTEQHLAVSIPISGARVKTAGSIPHIDNAEAVVRMVGTRTSIDFTGGTASLGATGDLQVGPSRLTFGSYTNPNLPMNLDLTLDGPLPALAALGARQPLTVSKTIGLDPNALSGRASAQIDLDMTMRPGGKIEPGNWNADIRLRKAASKKPIAGRLFEDGDLTIEADREWARINGTAIVEGTRAEIALVQPTDGSTGGSGSFKTTLSDKQREQMGISTGGLLTGTITVDVVRASNGDSKVTANLKRAQLSLPWIGWRKGEGIDATATFDLTQRGGTTRLTNLRLKGDSFSAQGEITVAGKVFREARFQNVRLNRTDDFNVAVSRSAKGAYAVDIDARSYDARSLIRGFFAKGKGAAAGEGASVTVSARVGRMFGFQRETLSDVTVDYSQRGSAITKAVVKGLSPGSAPTAFTLQPVQKGMETVIASANAGSILRFLDLYTKISGGRIDAKLVQDANEVYRGTVKAYDFTINDEPRLAKLLQKPTASPDLQNRDEIVRQLRRIPTRNARVDELTAVVEKGPTSLHIRKGRLTGGDASAAFEGRVYNAANNMKITGTFLPGRGLNRLVSNIPILGLAFGRGKVNGLLGITFKLSGRYGNPTLQVNPLSIIAPGVFRQLFRF